MTFDSVLNVIIPWIIAAIGIGIFYRAFKPIIENLTDLFKRIFRKFKKEPESEFAGGLDYE